MTDRDDEQVFDIAVVGAGPCGIAVGIAAQEAGLGCVLFDRGDQGLRVPDGRHHLVTAAAEQADEPFPQQHAVLGQYYAE